MRRDYTLHGKGRVWRIAAKVPTPLAAAPAKAYAADRDAELLANIQSGPTPTDAQIQQWLLSPKPYIFAAAVRRLSREGQQLRDFVSTSWTAPRITCGLLRASREAIIYEGLAEHAIMPVAADSLIRRGLSDPDEQVALLAMKWVSDLRLTNYKSLVATRAKDGIDSSTLYYAALTTLARLDDPKASEADLVKRLKADILDINVKPAVKRLALEILPDRDRNLRVEDFVPLLEKATAIHKAWLVHYLATLRNAERLPVLHRIAFNSNESPGVRAAALLHAEITSADVASLCELIMSAEQEPALALAAAQALQGQSLPAAQRDGLRQRAKSPALLQAVARVLGESFTGTRPPANKPEVWPQYLAKIPGSANLDNGRNVFLSPRLGGCAMCHRADSIGNAAGPNLSTIGHASEPNYLLESLLQPSRNVAPQFESYAITTTDGQTRMAFELTERGDDHTYIDLTGHTFEIKIADIVSRVPLPVSIMPEGLVSRLTDHELRDLVAYLTSLATTH